ncbi:hypothetical protein GCM10010430_22130 [Kitasatospora cystarginea]|uniref:Uncharacterized protein n=2 Tax=Kitasatospora cystarginea TaxID=58350 RepID=A0ABN3DSK5_9ACTN
MALGGEGGGGIGNVQRISKLTGQPRCGRCDQREVHCTVCGRFRDIHSGTADAPVCGPCTKPDTELWRPCPICGEAERLTTPGPCRRCTLKQRLNGLLTDDTGAVPPKLQALHDALADTRRTATAMSWLSKDIVSAVLSDLASGRRPLTHEALDDLPDSKVVEHIRSVLVAAGALPPRDEQMVRLERHVKDLVASHATPEGRQILHRYTTGGGAGGGAPPPRRALAAPGVMAYVLPAGRCKPPATCPDCFGWGVLPGRTCSACQSFRRTEEPAECSGCRRLVRLKKGYCRLCWRRFSTGPVATAGRSRFPDHRRGPGRPLTVDGGLDHVLLQGVERGEPGHRGALLGVVLAALHSRTGVSSACAGPTPRSWRTPVTIADGET